MTPAALCTIQVTTEDAATSAKSGSFSSTSGRTSVCFRRRPSGHQSRRSSVNGSVTSIGFAMSPSARPPTTARYRPVPRRRVHATYASVVRSQRHVLRTSFRSATQATDSTCSGWTPKSAATSALRQGAPVIASSSQNTRSVFTTCSATLVA
jgi:hypothetical protein